VSGGRRNLRSNQLRELIESFKPFFDQNASGGALEGLLAIMRDVGNICLEMKRDIGERAIVEALAALKKDPNDRAARVRLGTRYYNDGDHRGAIAAYNEAERLGSTDSTIYLYRGHSYLNQKRYQQAIRDFSKTIASGSDEPLARVGKGMAHLGMAQFAQTMAMQKVQAGESVAECGNAIAAGVQTDIQYQARLCRALAYAAIEEFSKSVEDMNVRFKMDPDDQSNYLALAIISGRREISTTQ
jgi:tetratricopeptide (TPR) repeat protein